MLVKLLTTLCLVALAASIDDLPFPILKTLGVYPSDHITVSSRVQSADLRLFDGPHYYIPNGECHGYLDTTRLCGDEKVEGIEARVTDPHGFARVKVHPKRGKLRILRRGRATNGTILYCPDVALVDVRLSCDHWQFSHSRNRARLPSLLDSDSNSSNDFNEDDDVEDAGEASSQ